MAEVAARVEAAWEAVGTGMVAPAELALAVAAAMVSAESKVMANAAEA